MARALRLTTNAGETELASLLSSDAIFQIPYFQRPYRWKTKKLETLNADLLRLVAEEDDVHFLGAIIIHGRRSNPSDPNMYEVIDGQQRLTTVYLYICAIVAILCKHKEYSEAAGLLQKYLIIPRRISFVSNSKLQPGKDGRAQLNRILEKLVTDEKFAQHISNVEYVPMPAVGSERGQLRKNYSHLKAWLVQQAKSEGIERIRAIYRVLLNSVSVVQIDVSDPTNGPKIFDCLNSRQEPMTIGDLVRNEIFSKAADEEPGVLDNIDQHHWQPFYEKFAIEGRSYFDGYFFPYGLIQNPNMRKSEAYDRLRDDWSKIADPKVVISKLAEYQPAYLDLIDGGNRQGHGPEVAKRLDALRRAHAPSSVFPFIMQLSNATRDGDVTAADAESILKLIESFLVRRAVCGHEPTGLHAVFKRLWNGLDGNYTSAKVEEEIRGHKTVTWPGDDEVAKAVNSRSMYGTSICAYFLAEWNASLGGDQPGVISEIEHVLPQKPEEGEWSQFAPEQHNEMVDRLANLVPLSQPMNRSLKNKAYQLKRPIYLEDSCFKATRKFAEQFDDWTPTALRRRGEALAKFSVQRWEK